MLVIVSLSLLLLGFGEIPVSAYGEELKEFNSLGKGTVEFVPDEIVVKFKNDSKPFRVIKIPEGKVKEKTVEYSLRPDVVYAEPNYYAHAFSDDPLYPNQWNFGATTTGGIGMDDAWNISTGEGVIVAIVDTGIAYEDYLNYVKAPDFANTGFVPGFDFVNKDSHANDDNSHGTHVAGTVAQSTNNKIGVSGVAYNARLMPVKVLNKKGSGTYDNIALGIRWAADNGAKVINMSLGGPVPAQVLKDALAYAYAKGVTIVAAAGNDGVGTISYPAAYDDYVIAVGATRKDMKLASYSNYGSSLDLVAPGGDLTVDQNSDGYADGILQNTFNPDTKNTSDFGYYFFQGTSMASPHVAGVAALLIANGNATTPSEIQSALQETAQDLGSTTGWESTFGWGLVDAFAALKWTAKLNTAPSAVSELFSTYEDIPLGITLSASDPDSDPLTYIIDTEPSNGTLSGTAPNVTYTPRANFNGSDSFTFRAYDGKLYSNSATVSIMVNPVNDPPVATDQSVTTFKNTPLDITLAATDPDGDSLTDLVTGPTNGSLLWLPGNVVTTYTPEKDYTGSDSFTYTISDSNGGTASATVSIEVTEVPTTSNVNVSIDITTATKIAGKLTFKWAIATVTVQESGAPVANATVAGHWEGATIDTDSGITDLNGTVSLMSNQVKATSTIKFIFVVDSVTIGGAIHEPTGEQSDSIT